MNRQDYHNRFERVFEKSSWVVDEAWQPEFYKRDPDFKQLFESMKLVLRRSGKTKQLKLLRAHPNLADRLAVRKGLTNESAAEQSSAGLDYCTAKEFHEFRTLNTEYSRKFDFPFIVAVRDLDRQKILQIFRARLKNSIEAEFEEALKQVERIAYLRLQDLMS